MLERGRTSGEANPANGPVPSDPAPLAGPETLEERVLRLERTSSLAHGGYMVNIYTQSDHACNSLDDDSQRKVRLETSLMPFYLGAPGEPGAIQDMVAR